MAMCWISIVLFLRYLCVAEESGGLTLILAPVIYRLRRGYLIIKESSKIKYISIAHLL